MLKAEKLEFPRYVYKRGTGKEVEGTNGRFQAEGVLVNSKEQLDALEGEWCDSPAAAAPAKKEAAPVEPSKDAHLDLGEDHGKHKKVK